MMNRQKQQRLRKHPLIRFLRAIIRIGRVFFKQSRKKIFVSQFERISSFEPPIGDLADREIDRPIIIEAPQPSLTDSSLTVGELLGLVEWRLPVPVLQAAPAAPQQKKSAIRSTEYRGILNISKAKSQDQSITVGELFEMVQWQAVAPPSLVAMPIAPSDDRTSIQDFSLN